MRSNLQLRAGRGERETLSGCSTAAVSSSRACWRPSMRRASRCCSSCTWCARASSRHASSPRSLKRCGGARACASYSTGLARSGLRGRSPAAARRGRGAALLQSAAPAAAPRQPAARPSQTSGHRRAHRVRRRCGTHGQLRPRRSPRPVARAHGRDGKPRWSPTGSVRSRAPGAAAARSWRCPSRPPVSAPRVSGAAGRLSLSGSPRQRSRCWPAA